MSVLYGIWLLLPLAFFALAIWGFVKPLFGKHGKEHSGLYFRQGIYCLILLAPAVWIDGSQWFPELVDLLSWGMLDIAVASWLLYPALLLLAATIQRIVKKESSQRILPTRRFS